MCTESRSDSFVLPLNIALAFHLSLTMLYYPIWISSIALLDYFDIVIGPTIKLWLVRLLTESVGAQLLIRCWLQLSKVVLRVGRCDQGCAALRERSVIWSWIIFSDFAFQVILLVALLIRLPRLILCQWRLTWVVRYISFDVSLQTLHWISFEQSDLLFLAA